MCGTHTLYWGIPQTPQSRKERFLNKNTKNPNRKRKHHISCYLDDREYITFRDKKSKTYYNQSEYIRKCVLDKKITVIPGVRDLVVDLKRIGNNLNQLTYNVNSGKVVFLGDDLKEINDDLASVWSRLNEVIKKVK
jgi:hypothetical protein